MLPPPTSKPFSTRSYARAFAVSGARSSRAGDVNGWCTETQRSSSSLYSNSGGSTIQQNAQASSGISSSRAARSRRRPSSATLARSSRSATMQTRSPSAAPVRATSTLRLLGREELLDGRADRAVGLDRHPDEPGGAAALRVLDQPVELLARERRRARRGERLDHARRRRAPMANALNPVAAKTGARSTSSMP